MSRTKRVAYSLTCLALTLVVAEGFLRLQQVVGPIIDLVPPALPIGSSSVHHAPGLIRHLEGKEGPYTIVYNEHSLRVNSRRPSDLGGAGPRVLFLGDSFMEGYDDDHTIPQVAWKHLFDRGVITREARFFNAGYWSYAPSIYTVRAKQLFGVVRPTHVLVEIDETDLMDEWIRYRRVAVTDASGSVVAVPHALTGSERAYYDGLNESCSRTLYLGRLLGKMRFTRFGGYERRLSELPWDEVVSADSLLSASRLTGPVARSRYAPQFALFETRVSDLLATLTAEVGRDRVLLSYHPHRLHVTSTAEGLRYNSEIAASLLSSARSHGVAFVDNRGRFPADCDELFLWPADPFSHFTRAGVQEYGLMVADSLESLLVLDRR